VGGAVCRDADATGFGAWAAERGCETGSARLLTGALLFAGAAEVSVSGVWLGSDGLAVPISASVSWTG
jgi:hypothetical protein